MASKWTTAYINQVMKDYERSGVRRRRYCSQIGMPVSTFDYYRRRWLGQIRRGQAKPNGSSGLMKVELLATPEKPPKANAGFTLVLGNGQRRIESGWNFADERLARLIRI